MNWKWSLLINVRGERKRIFVWTAINQARRTATKIGELEIAELKANWRANNEQAEISNEKNVLEIEMDENRESSKLRKQKQLGPAPIASFEDTSSDSELKFKVSVEHPRCSDSNTIS